MTGTLPFPPTSLLASHPFPLFPALTHLNVAVTHFHMLLRPSISHCCTGCFVFASAFAPAFYCISSVFLVVRHSPDMKSTVDWGERLKDQREISGESSVSSVILILSDLNVLLIMKSKCEMNQGSMSTRDCFSFLSKKVCFCSSVIILSRMSLNHFTS